MQVSQESGGQRQQQRGDAPSAVPTGRNPATGSSRMRPPDDISELVQEVSRLLRNRAADSIASVGINHVRQAVLRAVGESEPDGCTQAELAERLRQSDSNICTLVERMRSDGMLYRRRSKTDRRKRILGLTDNGRTLLANAEQCCQQVSAQLSRTLTSPQHSTLVELLRLLIDALSQDRPTTAESPRHAAPPDPHFISNCDGMIKPPSIDSTESRQWEATE